MYSVGGAVDTEGVGGAAQAGVRGLPGVLSTKVFVLLRPGEVRGTLVISASGAVGLTLSTATLPVSMR